MTDRLIGVEVSELPAFLKVLLRGGGGEEHDRMKLAGWFWLAEQGFKLIDFEVGGFDVLGLDYALTAEGRRRRYEDPLDLIRDRIVLDAKASMSDVYGHWKKASIPDCDIRERFSRYANLHYIISRKGVVNPEAIHPPWGLLEYDGSVVIVKRAAEERVYIGETVQEAALDLATRTEKMLRAIIKHPSLAEAMKTAIDPKVFLEEKVAKQELVALHNELLRGFSTFEHLYGYHPINRRARISED
jgi:hypothetical protein